MELGMGLSLIILFFRNVPLAEGWRRQQQGKKEAGGNWCENRNWAFKAGGVGFDFQFWDRGKMS